MPHDGESKGVNMEEERDGAGITTQVSIKEKGLTVEGKEDGTMERNGRIGEECSPEMGANQRSQAKRRAATRPSFVAKGG